MHGEAIVRAAREKGIELAPSPVEELPDEMMVYVEAYTELAGTSHDWITLWTYACANDLQYTDFMPIMMELYKVLSNGEGSDKR